MLLNVALFLRPASRFAACLVLALGCRQCLADGLDTDPDTGYVLSINQSGEENSVDLSQEGGNNRQDLVQQGERNIVVVVQSGFGNRFVGNMTGNDNILQVQQSGQGNATVNFVSGNRNVAVINQR